MDIIEGNMHQMSPSSVIPVCSQLHSHPWHINTACKERGDAWLQWWEQHCTSQRGIVAPLKTQCDCIDPVLLRAAQAVLVPLESSCPIGHFSSFVSFVLLFLVAMCSLEVLLALAAVALSQHLPDGLHCSTVGSLSCSPGSGPITFTGCASMFSPFLYSGNHFLSKGVDEKYIS